ncbi:unnamed protein product [Microthlaspi erraticum]|uniref:Uncharacterized protein n=1 Tax=Microthlaspi erraticum TaxID=1685480 RepID=A0A6D2I327_9BRAS|nr:unnamed protein product [Microthlaspi erraticum]
MAQSGLRFLHLFGGSLLLCWILQQTSRYFYREKASESLTSLLADEPFASPLLLYQSQSSPAQDCSETDLSDPLLTEKPRKNSAEDIPSVVPEDEAELAYSKFSQAWDTLLREGCSTKKTNLVFRAVAKFTSRKTYS